MKYLFTLLLTFVLVMRLYCQVSYVYPPALCSELNGAYFCASVYTYGSTPNGDNLLGGENSLAGTGCKLFWKDSKCAIRGGELSTIPMWDTDSLGIASASFGKDTKALGDRSFSTGLEAEALANLSFAMGKKVVARNLNDLAIGIDTEASGSRSIAVGNEVEAINQGSIAIGKQSINESTNGITIGKHLTANGNTSNYIIGTGFDDTNHLENDINQSLMIGFGSNIPTVFVERASGFNQTGDVGIGNTDPKQDLDVSGAIRIDTTSTGIDGSLRYTGTSFQGYTNGVWVTLASGTSGSVFQQSNSDAFYSAGQVGIGTSSPTTALEVNGDITITGSVVGPSDLQLKDNVRELNDALSIIRQLEPKAYQYDTDSDHQLPKDLQYGFIAQDVQSILPELVNDHALVSESGIAQLGINTQQLVSILVQGLKELATENQDLKTQYHSRLSSIEKSLDAR